MSTEVATDAGWSALSWGDGGGWVSTKDCAIPGLDDGQQGAAGAKGDVSRLAVRAGEPDPIGTKRIDHTCDVFLDGAERQAPQTAGPRTGARGMGRVRRGVSRMVVRGDVTGGSGGESGEDGFLLGASWRRGGIHDGDGRRGPPLSTDSGAEQGDAGREKLSPDRTGRLGPPGAMQGGREGPHEGWRRWRADGMEKLVSHRMQRVDDAADGACSPGRAHD